MFSLNSLNFFRGTMESLLNWFGNAVSSKNSTSTLEKGGKNPPSSTLDSIFDDVLKYLNESVILCETKTEIENKCDIKEHDDCWSEDDIKRAWEETRRIGDTSCWDLVIVLQILKRQRSKEEDPDERSTQKTAQLKKLEDAGEDVQSSEFKTSSYHEQQSWASEAIEAIGNSSSDVKNMIAEDKIMFIRIPCLKKFHNAPTVTDDYVPSRYKLINGFPSDNTVNSKRSYAMSFDKFTGNAECVYEILNSETLEDNCKEISFGDVYHKGHLAPAANHKWCWEAYNDTFVFSNIIPQHKKFNQGMWRKPENYCRNIQKMKKCNVHVYTGPLYLRPTDELVFDGRRKIIPTHLFKVIIVENTDGTVEEPECYVMPNEEPKGNKTFDKYLMSIDKFEKYSGLKFIERRANFGNERKLSVRLQGEDLYNVTPRYVDINVRIVE